MTEKVVRVRGQRLPPAAHRPETFDSGSVGVVLPAGTRGLYKVTGNSAHGPGEYLTGTRPPTQESARRRLELPPTNPASEVREYRATRSVYADLGVVSGGSAGDLQFEVKNPEALEEVRRWSLPLDAEVRFVRMLAGAAIGAVAGAAIGYALGGTFIGLLLGIAVGFLIGLLFPTDWAEVFSIAFGVPAMAFVFDRA